MVPLVRCIIVSNALSIAIASRGIAQARPIGIAHVTVIDVEHGKRLRDYTVIVEGNRIATVGPSAQVRIPDGYGVVDARGKFVVPGLIDVHGHFASDSAGSSDKGLTRFLERAVLSGVTTVVEPIAVGLDTAFVASRTDRESAGMPLARLRWRLAPERGGSVPALDGDHATSVVIHDELRQAVARGLTPTDALRAVTFDAARALGLQKDFGSVVPGKIADFLILDASPLDDIGSVSKIDAIVLNGRFIDGAERANLLARAGVTVR